MTRLWLVLLLLGLSALTAYADGDIVYAARYYLPPGSKGTSHFHLYRINPDGTGKMQITYGRHDDDDPLWSPDGRLISFSRDNKLLCVLNVGSGRLTTFPGNAFGDVEWWPDSRSLFVFSSYYEKALCQMIDVLANRIVRSWGNLTDCNFSPNGKYAVLQSDKGVSRLVQVVGSEFVTLKTLDFAPYSTIWLTNSRLVSLIRHEDTTLPYLWLWDVSGKERWRIQFLPPKDQKDQWDSNNLFMAHELLSVPHQSRRLICAVDESTTSGRDNWFAWTDIPSWRMLSMAQGQFLSWSPTGMQFCTAPSNDTVPYQKRPYPYDNGDYLTDRYRMVWTSPLYVHDTKNGRLRQITSRLSWVTAADWRKVGR